LSLKIRATQSPGTAVRQGATSHWGMPPTSSGLMEIVPTKRQQHDQESQSHSGHSKCTSSIVCPHISPHNLALTHKSDSSDSLQLPFRSVSCIWLDITYCISSLHLFVLPVRACVHCLLRHRKIYLQLHRTESQNDNSPSPSHYSNSLHVTLLSLSQGTMIRCVPSLKDLFMTDES